MMCLRIALIALALLVPVSAGAQQEERYDYWMSQREMIRYGQQAVFMCNGLFTGNRTIENVFAQELGFLPSPVGTPGGGKLRHRRSAEGGRHRVSGRHACHAGGVP